jgi:hypothetical protein
MHASNFGVEIKIRQERYILPPDLSHEGGSSLNRGATVRFCKDRQSASVYSSKGNGKFVHVLT